MTIHIPVWLLWAGGVILVAAALAVGGIVALANMMSDKE